MRRSYPFALLAIALNVALIASPACAEIILATDYPSGSPLAMNSGSNSSNMTASVFDSTAGSATVDNLTGYQVRLQIVPQGGSVGTVTFATPTTGTAAAPANYVLAGANFGIATTNSSSSLFFFDFNFPFSGGVDVPQTPGKNLLAMTFTASAGALGLFDIMAVPNVPNTEWTDNSQPIQLRRTFGNVPDGGGLVVIGQVDVTAIPEPSAFALASFALGLWQFRRRSPISSRSKYCKLTPA